MAASDSDFCSTDHRTRFQARLKKVLLLLGSEAHHQAQLAPAVITYVPSVQPPRPAQPDGFICSIRLPISDLSIVADVDPRPAVVVQPMLDITGRSPRTDRVAVLGSRLQALRTELERASGAPRRLAMV